MYTSLFYLPVLKSAVTSPLSLCVLAEIFKTYSYCSAKTREYQNQFFRICLIWIFLQAAIVDVFKVILVYRGIRFKSGLV
jgi:hypothetical protein